MGEARPPFPKTGSKLWGNNIGAHEYRVDARFELYVNLPVWSELAIIGGQFLVFGKINRRNGSPFGQPNYSFLKAHHCVYQLWAGPHGTKFAVGRFPDFLGYAVVIPVCSAAYSQPASGLLLALRVIKLC
jgi:hypothetical protein